MSDPRLPLGFKILKSLLVWHYKGLLHPRRFNVGLNTGQIMFVIQELLRLAVEQHL